MAAPEAASDNGVHSAEDDDVSECTCGQPGAAAHKDWYGSDSSEEPVELQEALIAQLVDTHCHPHDAFRGLKKKKRARSGAKRLGQLSVSRLVLMGVAPEDWDLVEELARLAPGKVVPSFGLHPW